MEETRDIKAALAALGSRRKVLNALDDKISDSICSVEDALRQHMSIRVQVDIGDGEDLAFGKINNRWCLIWCHDGSETPLLSAPRDIRAEAFSLGQIGALIVAAAQQIDEAIAMRNAAVEAAAEISAALTVVTSGHELPPPPARESGCDQPAVRTEPTERPA